jgi:hypothetical protein
MNHSTRVVRPPQRAWPPAARTAAAIMATALALLAAACSGSSSSTGSGGAPNAGGSANSSSANSQKALAFSRCVRARGVPNFPDPASSGGIPKQAVVSAFQAVSASQAKAAQEACNHLVPAGGLSGQPVQTITAQDRQDYLRAAACMRSHGFAGFPDPTFPNNTITLHIPSSIDQESPRFKSAATTCVKLIPAGLPYSRSSRS